MSKKDKSSPEFLVKTLKRKHNGTGEEEDHRHSQFHKALSCALEFLEEPQGDSQHPEPLSTCDQPLQEPL